MTPKTRTMAPPRMTQTPNTNPVANTAAPNANTNGQIVEAGN